MQNPKDLAGKLANSLAQLTARGALATTAATTLEEANALADLSASLHQQLAALPVETRHLLHAADSGFASSGQWVDAAIDAQTQNMVKLARATIMLASWLGPNGLSAERVFVIRGHIRGWAHRWRQEELGPGQVDSDPEFIEFASECLSQAGIKDDYAALIDKALKSDWRTC